MATVEKMAAGIAKNAPIAVAQAKPFTAAMTGQCRVSISRKILFPYAPYSAASSTVLSFCRLNRRQQGTTASGGNTMENVILEKNGHVSKITINRPKANPGVMPRPTSG